MSVRLCWTQDAQESHCAISLDSVIVVARLEIGQPEARKGIHLRREVRIIGIMKPRCTPSIKFMPTRRGENHAGRQTDGLAQTTSLLSFGVGSCRCNARLRCRAPTARSGRPILHSKASHQSSSFSSPAPWIPCIQGFGLIEGWVQTSCVGRGQVAR